MKQTVDGGGNGNRLACERTGNTGQDDERIPAVVPARHRDCLVCNVVVGLNNRTSHGGDDDDDDGTGVIVRLCLSL